MFQRQPTYVSPVHPVRRVRVRARHLRSRPDVVALYGLAAVAGMALGLVMSVLA